MRIVLKQNEIGRFNWTGNEKSLSVNIGIYDNEGNIIREGDNSATLHFSFDSYLEQNQRDIDYYFKYLWIEELLNIQKEYIKSIWSTRDYKGDMNLFIKIFKENQFNIVSNHQEKLLSSIKEEEEKIKSIKIIDDDNLEFYKYDLGK